VVLENNERRSVVICIDRCGLFVYCNRSRREYGKYVTQELVGILDEDWFGPSGKTAKGQTKNKKWSGRMIANDRVKSWAFTGGGGGGGSANVGDKYFQFEPGHLIELRSSNNTHIVSEI
jgi:hypothetical protein